MTSTGIAFDDVWKSYPRWDYTPTLRSLLAGRAPKRSGGREWAVQAISFDVEPGRFVGLIGPNGAGKSTLLRLASGVSRPTRGRARVPADTAAVLSLGYAFDGTLSGTENAQTSALLAGMSPRQAREAVPGIIAFAELEEDADAPLRTYSEGMKLRLAFGVVAALEPSALLLDEVFAVGDLRFQHKCLDRIAELRQRGTSVLFASHDLQQVAETCDRAVWLAAGRLREEGPARDVVASYQEATHRETRARTPEGEAADGDLVLGRNRLGSQEAEVGGVRISGDGDPSAPELGPADPLEVRFTVDPKGQRLKAPRLTVAIRRWQDGAVLVDSNTEADRVALGDLSGPAAVVVRFPRPGLLPGEYTLDVGVFAEDWAYAYDFHAAAYRFSVRGHSNSYGVVDPPRTWEIERG